MAMNYNGYERNSASEILTIVFHVYLYEWNEKINVDYILYNKRRKEFVLNFLLLNCFDFKYF